MQTRKSGKGGASIPYSSIANLLLGGCRSFAAILRMAQKLKDSRYLGNYLERAQVARILLEHLEEALDGVCQEEDMVAVCQAIAVMYINSTWAKEARKDG
jgi:hypothetical protein